jgi:integrase
VGKKRAHGEGSINKRSDGRWEAKVSLGYDTEGKRKRKTVYGRTQAEVRDKLDALRRQVSDGTYADTKLTLKDYLNKWLDHKASNVRPRTLSDYRYMIDKYIIPPMGGKQLSKVKPLDVQAFVDATADSAGARTANLCRTVLFSALRQAVRWELIARNPVEAVTTVKMTPRKQIIWTAEEAVQFLDTARPHRLYALFHLVMSTGLRHGEALKLRWSDIQGNVLTVRDAKTTKGNRRVTLSDDILSVLMTHRQHQEAEKAHVRDLWRDSDLVFTSEVGTPLDQSNVNHTRRRIETKAGVRHATMHDLRHLNVSLRRRQGQDAKLIADQVGHTDPAFTTRLYTHLFEDDREAAAVSLAEAFKTKGQTN